MNQKKLKKLRKLARAVTVNLPEKQLVSASQPSLRTEAHRAVNSMKTTRGTYRWLKGQENLFDGRGAFRAARAANRAAAANAGEKPAEREGGATAAQAGVRQAVLRGLLTRR